MNKDIGQYILSQFKECDCNYVLSNMLSRIDSTWLHEEFLELYLSKFCPTPEDSVFYHTGRVLGCLKTNHLIPRLAVLFHDLGKVDTQLETDGHIAFPGHQNISSDIAYEVLSKWKLHHIAVRRICSIIKEHMRDISQIKSQKSIRNFIGVVGYNNINYWFALREADILSYGSSPENLDRFRDKVKSLVTEETLTTLKDLALNDGRIGVYKGIVVDAINAGICLNTKEGILNFINNQDNGFII